MSASYGNKIKMTLFGERDAAGAGVLVEGLPAGFPLPDALLGERVGSYKLLSGVTEGKANGSPLAALLLPTTEDTPPVGVLRPGQADLGLYKKNGARPETMGVLLSEQAVSPLLFAGTLAESLLQSKHTAVYTHIFSVCEVQDESFEALGEPERAVANIRKDFPVLDARKEMLMKLRLAQAENAGDTLGFQIEGMVLGLAAGVGNPVFTGIKSRLSALLFALPRVTAVEFGAGVGATLMPGSDFNDTPFVDTLNGRIATRTNHAGGQVDGITNGMPLLIRVSFAPHPAIGKAQQTVHALDKRDVTLPSYEEIVTCDAKKMCTLVKAAIAFVLADFLA